MLHLYSPLQVNIGELERPDQKPYPIKGLPGIMARAIGRDMEEIYKGNNKVCEGGEGTCLCALGGGMAEGAQKAIITASSPPSLISLRPSSFPHPAPSPPPPFRVSWLTLTCSSASPAPAATA